MNSGDQSVDTHSSTITATESDRKNLSDKHLVSGVVNRVKVPDTNERRVVLTDPSIETIMLPIDCVRRLVNHHGETARRYFRDDQTIITTTTAHDDTLKELDWMEELDIVRRFGPDYHIPTEYSVYESSMSPLEQERAIADCMDGTEWFAKRLENHTTSVLLQAKGWLPWHYELCRPTMKHLDTDFLVFYAAGYQARVYELKADLDALISVLKPSGILLIGKQSTRFLSKAAPEIVAAAGARWRRKSGLVEAEHKPEKHSHWKAEVEKHLGTGQAIIDSYISTKVKENG